MAAVIGGIVAWACSYLPGGRPMTPRRFLEMTDDCARQASQVAIPIAAIGIIIGVAVQSNLAIKFSTEMLALGGGTLVGSLFFISLGIIVLGMGLPTVAAYVIGAILFVPALQKLGVDRAGVAFLRAVLCRAVDGHAAGRAGVLHRRRHRHGESEQDRALCLHSRPADVPHPDRVRARPGDPVCRRLPLQTLPCRAGAGCGAAAWTIMISGYRWRPECVERVLFGLISMCLILTPFGTGGKGCGRSPCSCCCWRGAIARG